MRTESVKSNDTQSMEAEMSIVLSSAAFQSGGTIPKKFTADGVDQSPPLAWSELPAGTKTLALICDDPDAPHGTWVHWVLFDLPGQSRELEEGVPTEGSLSNGAKQGKNDFGRIGYGGPSPPKGKPHRYFFTLYALDVAANLPSGASKSQLLEAMKGHVLSQGQLIGKYGR
jgi:Raf kinase inhibitor-like YbhB/YbcL family protein